MWFHANFDVNVLQKIPNAHKRRSLLGMLKCGDIESSYAACEHLVKIGLVKCVWWEAPDAMFESCYVYEEV